VAPKAPGEIEMPPTNKKRRCENCQLVKPTVTLRIVGPGDRRPICDTCWEKGKHDR